MANRGFRRVVTGEDERGESFVLRDSLTPVTDVRAVHWFTERTAAALRDPPALALSRLPMVPPAGATTFQYVVIPPESERSEERVAAFYARMFPPDSPERGDTDHHPGMHRTESIDYVVVLQGEPVLILKQGEARLKPFDAVVQRGTEHAWTNPGTEPAVLAVVTIDVAQAGIVAADPRRALGFAALYGLTPAETEVALALAAGDRMAEIARSRGVSLNTVRTLATRLRSKLGARSRAEVVHRVVAHLGAFMTVPAE